MATQSGALGLAMIDYARSLELGIAEFALIGNKADVGVALHLADAAAVIAAVEAIARSRAARWLPRLTRRRSRGADRCPAPGLGARGAGARARRVRSQSGRYTSAAVAVDARARFAGAQLPAS
jgi:acyl-CoA synthetase (NDP forming)